MANRCGLREFSVKLTYSFCKFKSSGTKFFTPFESVLFMILRWVDFCACRCIRSHEQVLFITIVFTLDRLLGPSVYSEPRTSPAACMASIIWVSWWDVRVGRLRRSSPNAPYCSSFVLADTALLRSLQVSLDPVNPAISPYPPPFNQRLEEAYNKFSPSDPSSHRCVLGPDYFNSTIYFQTQGEVRRCPAAPEAGHACPALFVGPSCHACVACGTCISSAYAWAVHEQRLSACACCRRPANTFRRPRPSTMDRVADASRQGTVIALLSPF
jgi:hypothetical protein